MAYRRLIEREEVGVCQGMRAQLETTRGKKFADLFITQFGNTLEFVTVMDRHDRDWSRSRKAHHDDEELKAIPKLSDEQVKSLLVSGCFELGAHTLTHPNFLTLDEAALRHELCESKRQLEQCFKVPVRSFAYPFGLYRKAQVALVREAGYDSAVTVHEGIENPLSRNPLELARIKVSGRDGMPAFRLRMRTGKRGV
jgi:peptidoglycan/xylan/chitin deacetylase (PgdA/CDA1 family)